MQPRKPQKLGDRILRISRSRVEPWRVPLAMARVPSRFHNMPFALLVYGFAGIIALGALLLWLPVSSKSGEFTSFLNALFTSTSAVCVTGLAVVDTGTYWSSFGQGVILVLIQIGGLGFMTGATLLLLAFGRRIGLKQKLLIGDSLGVEKLGGLMPLVIGIAVFTLVVESFGAVIFYARFSSQSPPSTAAWQSIFHAVSAFNNCGLDIFGNFRSLTDYQGDPLVLLTTAALIILGGISFIVVIDVFGARRFNRLSLDGKIVLTTTLALLALGTIVILVTEFNNELTLGPMSWPQKVLDAFFQSVTPRTAGFNVIAIGSMAVYSLFFTIMLMFVGGASGSTAGGIKVNTFGMLLATVWSTIRGKEHPGAFGREFRPQQTHRALTVAMLSLGLVGIVTLVLTITEKSDFIKVLFETVSAFGTVGLSTGITPSLSLAGKLIITITMFAGRLGPLTLALSLIQSQEPSAYRYPQGDVRIG